MARKLFFTLLLVVFIAPGVFSQGENLSRGENLTLKVVVVGPGTNLYLWWGHIGLIIEDSFTGRNYIFDYGQFSFEQDNFFYNFAFGRLYYNCGAANAENFLLYNSRDNRDVTVYTLNVPPQKRLEVMEFAERNVLPENRIYEYHHFKDNCSTRIRDIIDIATDGQFSAKYKNEQGRYTLRQHVRRHTWFSPAADWILNFWMGQVIDAPITVWEEMFLPSEVGKRMEEFYYNDSAGENRKLVTSVDIINKAKNRPQVLDIPRKQWPQELLFSLALSVILGFFYFLTSRNKKAGRILAGFSACLCSLVFGIAGFLLYFMGIFTNHDYTYSNLNMLFCSPILLLAAPFGICFAFAKDRNKMLTYDIWIRAIWLLTVIGIFISMLLKITPWIYQDNLTDQMLMLPIALVFAFQPVGLKDARHRVLAGIHAKIEKALK